LECQGRTVGAAPVVLCRAFRSSSCRKKFFAPVLVHMSCPCTAQLHSYSKVLAKMRGGCRRTRCDRWLIHSHATQQSLSSLSPRTVTDSQYAYAIDGYQTTHNPNQWQSSCFCNQQQGHACLNIQSSRCGRIFAEFLPTLRWLSAREICAGGRPDDVAVGPQLIKRVEGSWTQMVARQHSSYE
jgi:hypothetical protein